jgi:hypothetical protein
MQNSIFDPDFAEWYVRSGRRPKGRVHTRAFRRGRLLWECERDNLFVNAGKPELANLLGNLGTGQFVGAVGWGSNGTAASLTDTALTNPSYYRAPASASVAGTTLTIGLTIGTSDPAAAGMTIQELGLFANTGAVSLPAAVGITAFTTTWAASTVETVGNIIVDANGNFQQATSVSSDAKTGTVAPTWATTYGTHTIDNHVTWTLIAFHQAPGPLIARSTTPSVAFGAIATLSSTWNLTF